MKEAKTNALRILDSAHVPYTTLTYDASGGIDGLHVAQALGQDEALVYKTLITQGKSGAHYVFVLPVAKELDLKRAAAAVGEKHVAMIAVKDILQISGYVRGGCSPVGMKKAFRTIVDQSAEALSHFYVSGGRIGLQVCLCPRDVCALIGAAFEGITC